MTKNEKKLKVRQGAKSPSATVKGEHVMYFAVKVAVARLGGIAVTARVLGVSETSVASWVAASRRTRPSDATLWDLSRRSGVDHSCLVRYYSNLETYRQNEYFRRRRPKEE